MTRSRYPQELRDRATRILGKIAQIVILLRLTGLCQELALIAAQVLVLFDLSPSLKRQLGDFLSGFRMF